MIVLQATNAYTSRAAMDRTPRATGERPLLPSPSWRPQTGSLYLPGRLRPSGDAGNMVRSGSAPGPTNYADYLLRAAAYLSRRRRGLTTAVSGRWLPQIGLIGYAS